MSPGDWANLFFLSTIGLSATSLALLVAWLRTRERAVRAETRLEHMPRPVHRLEGTDRAIDAVAAEVARLSEGQEFLVRLLSDRSARPVHPAVEQHTP